MTVGNFLNKMTTSFWNSNLLVSLSTIPFYIAWRLSSPNEGKTFVSIYIIVWTLVKCGFFILYSLEKIMETYTSNKSFKWFLRQYTSVFFILIL